jgi:protein O-GlcNAc transferase
VSSVAEYEDLAVDLAARPQRLTEIRQKLAANRLTCPLFDTERFVRHLETAFEMMWAIHAAGAAPRPIYVPNHP